MRNFLLKTKYFCLPLLAFLSASKPRCPHLIPICAAVNLFCHTKWKVPRWGLCEEVPAVIQWTVASVGLKTAASSVPLAHWRMDKALDFTLLKEGESARGAMKSIDPSLNGFVRGFRLANHGWKSPLNKAQLLGKELGQIHQREEGKDNDSSWPDMRGWLHLHAVQGLVSKQQQ